MSFTWLKANTDEQRLIKAITILFNDDQRLLEFVFETKRPRLRKRSGILRDDSWNFSSAEQLLIRVALDFWSGSGHTQLWELLETWEPEHWHRFTQAITLELGERGGTRK